MKFQYGNLRERDHIEELGVDGKLMLSLRVRKCPQRVSSVAGRPDLKFVNFPEKFRVF
jgi:hypothetical protein